MTTTPETPALPGDLTDEMIERGARALAGLQPGEDWPTYEHLVGGPTGTHGNEYRDSMREQAGAVLAAARVAPAAPSEPSVAELEQVLGFPVADGHEPTDAHREFCREHGHAADRSRYPSPRCARCGEDRAPSPDREKLADELRVWASLAGYGTGHVTVRAAAALAVPPVVNKAKLEQALIGSLRDNAMMFENGAEEWIAESDPAECLPGLIESLVERQREWQGTGR